VPKSATLTVTHTTTVAGGVFAPGHLGELTQYLPFDVVDDTLESTGRTEQRIRDLPSRVGVYFVLAQCMYPHLGVQRVWQKMITGLEGVPVAHPSEKALRDLKQRLTPTPFKALFEVVAGPLGQPRTPGVSWRGYRTVAFDGCKSIKVPDTDRNRSWLGRVKCRTGFAGYPTLQLMALVETGTRALLGATLGTADDRSEPRLARRLVPLLTKDQLVLLDRGFDGKKLFTAIDKTGAKLLGRLTSSRRPPVLEHLPDGSYRSHIGELDVRIIEADMVVTLEDGSRVQDHYRLVTTLTDHNRHPAADLVHLYHERWEIETTFLALRHTMLGGQLPRSGNKFGVQQLLWALLTVHQLLRMAMVNAVESRPDADPDRASFTTALETAREELQAARGVCPDGPVDFLGNIGRAVLATLLPKRRPRVCSRTVKCSTSRYRAREPKDPTKPTKPTDILSIDITLQLPPITPTKASPKARPADGVPGTRRARIMAIMNSDRDRSWTGRELAERLVIPPRNMLTQLAEWARLGFLVRVNSGSYTLP
jgi:hypothetical protein